MEIKRALLKRKFKRDKQFGCSGALLTIGGEEDSAAPSFTMIGGANIPIAITQFFYHLTALLYSASLQSTSSALRNFNLFFKIQRPFVLCSSSLTLPTC
jgi:hypothetical protein